MNAKEANPGAYIIHKKEPFRVLKRESIAVGTHSHSKTKLTLQSLMSGKTDVISVSHHESMEEAEVTRHKGQVMTVDKEKGEAQIMDLESYETITAHFSEKLAENIDEGGTVAYVEYQKYCTITDARTYK